MTKQKTSGKRVGLKQKRKEEQARTARLKQIRVVGLGVILFLAIGGAVAWRNADKTPVDQAAALTLPNIDGAEDAAVTIVEYGDFGCPACRSWHNAGIREQIKATFGDQVSFEFRHFPVITQQSPKAAEAAQCAAEQGAFWEYHDYIYEQSPQGALRTADLESYAAAIGLDQDRFDSCLESGRYREYVRQDRQAAIDAGARGTPSFFISGQSVYPSFEGLAAAIEAELGG